MNARFLATIVVLLAVAFTASIARPLASAAGGAEIDEATYRDVALIAESHGWTFEQALAHEQASDILVGVAGRVQAEHPDVFVGSAAGQSHDDVPVIYIKGIADVAVRETIASAAIEIRLNDGQPFNLEELNERRIAVHTSLLDAGYAQVVTRSDITEQGALVVAVGPEADGSQPDRSAIFHVLPLELRDEVTIILLDEPVYVPDSQAYGGMWTTRYASQEDYCTSGWSVNEVGSSTTGVTTAGHCDETNGFKHPGVGVHSATLQGWDIGSLGDLGWYTTAQAEPAKFYADQGDIRDVNAVATASEYPIFQDVCVFGRATLKNYGIGRQCGYIVDPQVSCWSSNYLVLMDDSYTTGGDSGAGWSRYSKAFGSHVGRCYANTGTLKSAWMRTHYFDNFLGIEVRTQ